MGRCSGCNKRLVIKAGPGVTIAGAGTAETPLIITAESDGGGGVSGWSPGDVKYSAAAGAPPGWLIADGSPVSRTSYAALWAAMGSPDTGDGNTTFNLPDLTGRFPIGADSTHLLHAVGGAVNVLMTEDMVAGHVHTIESGGAHDHRTGHNDSDGGSASTFREGNGTGKTVDTSLVLSDGSHGHTVDKTPTGTPDPIPTMPPWTALTALVKT
jgi:microcystin-dependent protein